MIPETVLKGLRFKENYIASLVISKFLPISFSFDLKTALPLEGFTEARYGWNQIG
jgi:hypothetical protein